MYCNMTPPLSDILKRISQLEYRIKQTNIESEEKLVPKANFSSQMPVICVGDILFCDRIISISRDGLSWQVGADIDRNCLVIPRKTIGRLVQSNKAGFQVDTLISASHWLMITLLKIPFDWLRLIQSVSILKST